MTNMKSKISILGQRISLIRPNRPYQCKVYKNELPYARRQSCTKTVKEHCGKVVAVCVRLRGGGIRSIPTPATHLDVIEALVIDPDLVETTGWELENGNYLWR